MRALIQRIDYARVTVEGACEGSAGKGLLVFLGVGLEDDESRADQLAEKVLNLRIFEDEAGKMNCSLLDISGDLLVVSQFTLFADTGKGRRPSFTGACEPAKADELYKYFVARLRRSGLSVATGSFQKMMQVELMNNGPVTIMLDTDNYGGKK